MSSNRLAGVVGVALVAGLMVSSNAQAADLTEGFEARIYRDEAGKTLPYRLLKPKDYDPARRYPLVLFLHGAGERGTDNAKQLTHGAREFATPERQAKYPCFVVAPQCPEGIKWVDVDWGADAHVQPVQPTEPTRLALALVASLQHEFSIDARRLYVTGLSMGGFGTWDIITRYPRQFAAAVPVCGGADESKAPLIARMPIWAFHGDQDTTVKTKRSRNMIAALRAAEGNPRYTEYPGVGHGCWGPAYATAALYEWLFAQKLP